MVAGDLSNGSLAHLRVHQTAVKGWSEAGGGERRLEWMGDRMGAGFADLLTIMFLIGNGLKTSSTLRHF